MALLLLLAWVPLGTALAQVPEANAEPTAIDDIISPQEPWFSFAATPFLAPTNMARVMTGVKEKMEFVLKSRVRFHTSFDNDGFARRLARGADDFVLLYPGDYALARQHGYIPIAQAESRYKAHVVVPVSSRLRFTSDLQGKLLLLPGFGSPVPPLARQTLRNAGLDWERDVFTRELRSDGSCLREMLRGSGDACVSSRMATRVIQQQFELKLRAIGESPGLPPMLFAAHRRVSEDDRRKLRKALLSLANTESGRTRLRQTGFVRLVAFDEEAYRELAACSGPECPTDAVPARESQPEPEPEPDPVKQSDDPIEPRPEPPPAAEAATPSAPTTDPSS